mmetsp:Transcript_18393/g.21143  ORF Transcript_18393/g.21143 Transcript_18393/m.21143 type:complete len:181 (+) Transcript_18393:816-1358(+)
MRLLTGQLSENQLTTNSVANMSQNDQLEMLSKVMQNNPNLQNLAGLQGMQNLMNNQNFSSQSQPQNSSDSQMMSNLMPSLLNSGGQIPSYLQGMNPNLQNQLAQSQLTQSAQFLSNLMNASMQGQNLSSQWGMGQMNGMNNCFGGLDNQSLNDMIASQMMNFNNSNQYMQQDTPKSKGKK